MINTWNRCTHHLSSYHRCTILLLIALLLPLAGQAQASHAVPRAQPALLKLVADQPSARLEVIIQKLVNDGTVEALVSHLGGLVTRDLGMIDAFAAVVPAQDISELAHSAGVRWVSIDDALQQSNCTTCNSTQANLSSYVGTIQADRLWSEMSKKAQPVTVAVIDSGIARHTDLQGADNSNGNTDNGASRVLVDAQFPRSSYVPNDKLGHGTHIAGIIAGNGNASHGTYIGVAPTSNVVNVKVTDDTGKATTSDIISGLQWVYNNGTRYNIRVLNLSLTSTVADSYNSSPLDAALELLWFKNIVVVVSAGNGGPGQLYPPANDPFVITVGAANDQGTTDVQDDTVASFSAYGTTGDGFAKPDVVAPGTNIVSLLASSQAVLAQAHPDHIVAPGSYFRMSGTSMSAPVTAGAAALLLQGNPKLNPDQVKYRLISTASTFNTAAAGAGEINVYAAAHQSAATTANHGLILSRMLWNNSNPVAYDSGNWTSGNWTSGNWTSGNWTSGNWTSGNWTSGNWTSGNWTSDSWASDYWSQ